MKYVKTKFQTFLKYKFNEKFNLSEEESIEDNEKTENDDFEEIVKEPVEDDLPNSKNKKTKRDEDTIDELVKEYRRLQMEWDSLVSENQIKI